MNTTPIPPTDETTEVHGLRASFNPADHLLYFNGRDLVYMLTKLAENAKKAPTMTGAEVNFDMMQLVKILETTCEEAEAMCPICTKDSVQN